MWNEIFHTNTWSNLSIERGFQIAIARNALMTYGVKKAKVWVNAKVDDDYLSSFSFVSVSMLSCFIPVDITNL